MEDYVLIIESNGNTLEYPFSVEFLGSLNGVSDEIQIHLGKMKVIKKIGRTELDIYYVLEEPYEVEIETEPVKLFENYNKVYIQTLNGDYVLEYMLDNPFIGGLATKLELSESVSISLDKITLKVNKNEIISEINQTLEETSIKSNKIKLEGHTTINEHFKITPQGDMECVDANINGGLLTKSGIMTNMVFQSTALEKEYQPQRGLAFVGYNEDWPDYTNIKRIPLYVPYFIPKDFIVIESYLLVKHQSITWKYILAEFNNISIKDVEVYLQPKVDTGTSVIPATDSGIGSRINNVWGSGVHSYTFPRGFKTRKTADISSQLNANKQGTLAIAPRATDFTPKVDYYPHLRHSALMGATLYVFGYLNKE